MTKILIPACFVCIFLIACVQISQKADPELVAIDNILENKPDSALFYLNEIDSGLAFNNYNKAYYNILLAAARNRSGFSCIELDSLLDIAIYSLKERKDYNLLARAYLYKGRIWRELGSSEDAIHSLRKAQDLLEKYNSKDIEILSKVYDDLGNIYIDEMLYDTALQIFRKEYNLDAGINNAKGLTFSLRNMGMAYLYDEKMDSAFYYFNKSLHYAKLSPDSTYLINILYNDFSIYYESLGNYDLALEYLERRSDKDENVYLNKGILYYNFNQLDSANNIFVNLINSKDIYNQFSGYFYLIKIAHEKQDYKNAYDYLMEYFSLSDSIHLQKRTNDLRVLDYKYNVEKETIKMRNSYRLRDMIVGFIILFCLTVLIYNFVLNKKKLELREKEKDNRILRHEQDLLIKDQDLFFKEKEITGLNEKHLALQDEIIELQRQKSNDLVNFEEKIRKKEKEISFLLIEIEAKRFMTKPIYEYLLDLDKKVKTNAANDSVKQGDFEKVNKELENSFREFIVKLKEEYPDVKKEEIFILCMSKVDFSSTVIGKFLNVSDSAIRQRLRRLRGKIPVIFDKN